MLHQAQRAAVAALALVGLCGCGEVFADLDVRKQTVAEAWFEPASVSSGTKSWLEVRVRLDGGTADVQSHDLTGENNVKLAYDNLDFFPGTCPEANTELTQTSVASAAASAGSPVADTGEYVFCAAIEAGAFDATTSFDVGFTFWNGAESVFGTAPLTVYVASQ